MVLNVEHQLELAYFIARLSPVARALPGPPGQPDALTTSTINLGESLAMEITVTEPGRYAVATGTRVHLASESAKGYAWIVVEMRHRDGRTSVGSTLSMKYIDLCARDNLAKALAVVLKEFLSEPRLEGRFSLASKSTSMDLVVRGESI